MSAEGSQLLRIYLNRLIRSLIPPELGDEYSKTVFEELMVFIESKSSQQNWYGLQDALHNTDKRSDMTTSELTSAIDLISKFKPTDSIAKYLTFLNSLRDVEDTSYTQRETFYNDSSLPISRGNLSHLEGSNRYIDSRSISESQHGFNTAGDSFENINFDKFSDRRSLYSATPNRALNDTKAYSLDEVLIPYQENHIKEDEILRCLSFTLVGTTSDLLPYQGGSIKIPENISNSSSGILHIILECGLIHQNLTSTLDFFKSQRISSPTKNAVMSFISEQLTKYMRVVNVLSTKQRFSLLSLTADLSDELVKLRFLHYFTKQMSELPGHMVLTLAHDFTLHGDLCIRDLSHDLFAYSIESFSKELVSWLVNGELSTRSNEFFIEEAMNRQRLDSYIHIKYNKDKVPSFFTSDLGYKCYLIGKTNNFLRLCCNESSWSAEFSQRLSFKLENYKITTSALYNDFPFIQLIEGFYKEITRVFTDIVYSKHNLLNNLTALKNFLFMGKGDFIQSIIRIGSDTLNDPSSSLSGHQLTKLLQNAVLATSVRHELKSSPRNSVANNLDARILEIGHGNIGWDVFTLDYQIQPPINQILNASENALKKEYLKVFNYLWKLKRLEYLLEHEWAIQTKQRKLLISNKPFHRKVNRIRLIQNFLRGFLLSVQKFIFEDIIDSAYQKLLKDLRPVNHGSKVTIFKTGNDFKVAKDILAPCKGFKARVDNISSSEGHLVYSEHSIDHLEKLHSEYLISITKHKMINGSSSASKGKSSDKFYISQLNGLTNLVFKFAVTVKEFNSLVSEMNSQKTLEDSSFLVDNSDERFSTIYNNLLGLFGEFNNNLKVFINDLSNDDDLNMRQLGVSLNQ